MANDLYSDAEQAEGAPVESPAYDEDKTDEGGKTALLPKDFFPDGVKPGSMCSVRVVGVQDDQVEVQYEHDEANETPEDEAAERQAQPIRNAGDYME